MPTRSRSKQNLLAHLLLLAVVAVWGATFPLVKNALTDASPLLFNLLRMTLATAALATFNLSDLRRLSRHNVVLGLVAGVFLGAGYQLQTAGLARTSPTKSAFITGLVVVFVALVTVLPTPVSAHRPASRANILLGALLTFAGLVLLTTPPHTDWANLLSSIGLGDALTLLCAAAFAGHLLTLSRVPTGISAGALATVQIACATVLMLLTVRLDGPVFLHSSHRLWTALLLTSLLATAVAFTIQSWAQQHLPAPHTAVLLALEPVFALLTSIVFLHEHITTRLLIGAILILGGIFVIERVSFRTSPNAVPANPSSASPAPRN